MKTYIVNKITTVNTFGFHALHSIITLSAIITRKTTKYGIFEKRGRRGKEPSIEVG